MKKKAQSSSLGSPRILEKSALIRKTSTLRRVIAQQLRTPSSIYALDGRDHKFYPRPGNKQNQFKRTVYTQLKNVNEISERGSQCQQTRRKKGKKEKIQVVHKGPPSGNEFNKSYYALLNISTCLIFLVIHNVLMILSTMPWTIDMNILSPYEK